MCSQLSRAAAIVVFCTQAWCVSGAAAEGPPVGVEVIHVVLGGRGMLAGLQLGDILTRCGNAELKGAEDLAECLKTEAMKPTVEIEFFRDGERHSTGLVPGSPDVYVRPYREHYRAYLDGPGADPKWDTDVESGYAAFTARRWSDAAEHLERAAEAGMRDADVLKDLVRALLASLQADKAVTYARKALDVRPPDEEAAWLLYQSLVLTGGFMEAARLARRLKFSNSVWPWQGRPDRNKDAQGLRRAARIAKRAEAPPASGPTARQQLQDATALQKTLVENPWRKEILENVTYRCFAGKTSTVTRKLVRGDGVFSCKFHFLPGKNASFNGDARGHWVEVGNLSKKTYFLIGVDVDGALLLGQSRLERIGPCDAIRERPEANVIEIVRLGQVVEAYMNDRRILTWYVPAGTALRLFIVMCNCWVAYEEVSLSVPAEPE